LALYGEFISIEKDDLDSRARLLPLFLALAGNLLDLRPKQPISVDQPCDLEVAGLGGLGALGLQLRGFHAHGRERRILDAGQSDLRQLGVDFLGGPRQG
jgi:hypothetical protein